MRILVTLVKGLLGGATLLGVTTMPEDFAAFLRRVADMIAGGEHVVLWVIGAALILWAAFDVFKWLREKPVRSGKQSRTAPTVGDGEDRISADAVPAKEQTIPLPTALDRAWPMLEQLPSFGVFSDEPLKLFLNLTHRMFNGSYEAIPLYGIRVHRNTPECIADAHEYEFSADASKMANIWNAKNTVRDLHVHWSDVQNWISAQRRISQPRAPRASTWIPEAQALQIIRSSSLVRLRIPNDVTVADTLARALGDTYKTPGEQRIGEVSRHLLREFGSEIPGAFRSEQYGKEPLEWWIDKESDRRTAN